MKKYLDVLLRTPLFHNVQRDELASMLPCLSGTAQTYRRGETLLYTGGHLQAIGIVCIGAVQIERESMWGDRFIVAVIGEGDVFGEAVVCADLQESPVRIVAAADCEVLYIRLQKLIATCPSSCPHHVRLIGNMIRLLAQKNVLLNQKMDILTQKTTRDKLLAFFDVQMRRVGGRSFALPFTREALADYLGVNRSAMTRELGKMRDEGLLTIEGKQVRME